MRRPCSPARSRGALDRAAARPRRARAGGARRGRLRRTSRCASATAPWALPSTRPFQAIAVAAAAPEVPASLYAQLSRGRPARRAGRRPLRPSVSARRAHPEGLVEQRSIPCRFVPLVGAEGFRDRRAHRAAATCRSATLARPHGAVADRDRPRDQPRARGRCPAQRGNWEQLAKFCVVGATGYVVNLAVYTLLLRGLDLHYLPAAVGSFLVAVTNNYTWNRLWTFHGSRGHVVFQGLRFFVVSVLALCANLVVLHVLVQLGVGRGARPGDRDRPRHPGQLRRQQAVVVPLAARALPRPQPPRSSLSSPSRPRGPKHPTAPVYDGERQPDRDAVRAVRRAAQPPTEAQAVRRLLAVPKVAAWLERYPPTPLTEADFDRRTRRWHVHVWSGAAGEVATGGRRRRPRPRARGVDRAAGRVEDGARRGPARSAGARSRSWPVWLAFSAVFLLALADLRRPLALRNLDLLVLLSFGRLARRSSTAARSSAACRSSIRRSLYLLGRTAWIGSATAAASAPPRPVWPVWLLAAVSRLPRRPARRAQRRGATIRDRRRVRGRDRRRPHPRRSGAVRPHARSRTTAHRAGRRTPRARSGSGSR